MDQELYVDRVTSGQLVNANAATDAKRTLHVHSTDGSTFLHEMTSWPPSWKWKCDIKSKIWLSQSLHVYFEEQSRQISSQSDLKRGFLKTVAPTTRTTTTTTGWVAMYVGQVPDQKIHVVNANNSNDCKHDTMHQQSWNAYNWSHVNGDTHMENSENHQHIDTRQCGDG